MRSGGSWSTATSSKGIAAVVGVGPGLGRAIARKFAFEGYTVAILARDLGRLRRLAEEIAMEGNGQVFALRIDCSDTRSIREAFEGVLSLGIVEVLVYNAAADNCTPAAVLDIPIASFEKSLAVSSVGAFHCAQHVLPGMVERRRGTILFTGCSASINGVPGFSQLCCGKFALRGLSQCLAKEFHPFGVHVAHIILHGAVSPPRAMPAVGSSTTSTSSFLSKSTSPVAGDRVSMDPDAVAQTYWHLHTQDKSAWTQEIDLRPTTPTATMSATGGPYNYF